VVALNPGSFLLYDMAGALLWAGSWMTLGYVCSGVIGLQVAQAAPVGKPLAIGLAALLIAYLLFKYARRRRFLRHLREARLTPMELKRRLEAGDPPWDRRPENSAGHRDGSVQDPRSPLVRSGGAGASNPRDSTRQ
jgi:hypothetical protein